MKINLPDFYKCCSVDMVWQGPWEFVAAEAAAPQQVRICSLVE